MSDKYSMATINELESFNLADAVKFHDKLNPDLWINSKLDPEVRDQLLIIANDFVTSLGLNDLQIKDVTVSGSNAAYSYTPHSDLDLHVLVDMAKLRNDEVYRELFTAKKTLYNDSHDITVHGVPVELYVQDVNEPVKSLGEYSVLHDKWIRIPKKQRANFDQAATKAKFDNLAEIVELALDTTDLERVEKAIATIKRYRKAGLDKAGEFGPENLAFKAIRKQGGIQDLYDLRDQLRSEKLSIEEAATRDDAMMKIKKLMNTSGRTDNEKTNIKRIVDKMMKHWNLNPTELGIRAPVDPRKAMLAKAGYAKTMDAGKPNSTLSKDLFAEAADYESLGITFTQEPYEGWNGMGAMITAYWAGNDIGHVIFEPTDRDKNKWYATEVEVEDQFQRRGIATAMYDMAKKIAKKTNAVIVPSHAQTSDAKGLWKDKKVWEASGYIPSEKEKNDPRFKTALTVDVKPDAIKKNAKAFGWKTSRAGIPPQANPSGKIAESVVDERVVDPYDLGQRVAKRYGKKTKYGSWEKVKRAGHIPLRSYDEVLSDKLDDRYYKFLLSLGYREDKEKAMKTLKNFQTKKTFNIKDLIPSQPFARQDDPALSKQKIANVNPDNIRVMQLNGKYVIGDGHHSVMAAMLRGDKTVPATFLDLDAVYSNRDSVTESLIQEWKSFLAEDEEQQELFPGYDKEHREKRLSNWLAKSWGVQNGKPQTFYHATTKDFDTFNTHGTGFASALGMAYEVERHGSFFAVDPKFAEDFIEDPNTGRVKEGGRVLPVHLSIQYPIDLRDNALSRMVSDEETADEFKANGIDLRSVYDHFYELERWELFDGPEGAEFIDNLHKLGFDGAIINEAIPNNSNAKSGQVWVAFSPNQVKSVYNRGSFSPDDNRFTRESEERAGDRPKVAYHVTATKNLPIIQKNGIKADSRGNSYVWDSLEMAEWFSDFQNDEGQDRTILKVDMSGVNAHTDPEAEDMSEWSSRFKPGTNGGAWIVSGSITPDKIIG